MGTLTGPFFKHLIRSSSAGFTELILTGERVEAGIKSGKIQGATTSDTQITPYNRKKESNAENSQKGRLDQHVGAVLISNPTLAQQRQGHQHKEVAPKRQFTKINMSLSQALQHMLKTELITLKAPPQNPNTVAPSYHPNERCAYHTIFMVLGIIRTIVGL